MFANPIGGYEPSIDESLLRKVASGRLCNTLQFRVGGSFANLTLLGKLELGEHFTGHLIEGEFWPDPVLH